MHILGNKKYLARWGPVPICILGGTENILGIEQQLFGFAAFNPVSSRVTLPAYRGV
jgi:hypothetical protein